MEYINFGSTGLKVSPIALGLGLRGQASETQAARLIEHTLAQGVNLIDCANVYSTLDDHSRPGVSETILGRVLKGRRDDVVITSKVASRIGPGPNDQGLSRFHIMREAERSLSRLQTDHIDVYLLHIFDEQTPLEETIRALDDLVRQGKVRYLGCCNFAAWQVCRSLWLADCLDAAPFICVQNAYSLIVRQAENEMFGLLRDRGLGAMAYSPLGVGLLSGAYEPGQPAEAGSLFSQRKEVYENVMDGPAGDVVGTVIRLAGAIGKTPAQLAIAWVLSHPEITVAISGSDTIEQVDDALGALGWELDEAVRVELDEVSAHFVHGPRLV